MPQGFKGWAIFAAAQAAITFVLHWLAKLADNAVLTWIDDQIAMFLGFSQPQASTVISWVLPASIVFVTLLTYHVVQSRISRVAPTHVTIRGSQANVAGVVSNQQLPKSIDGAEKLFRITNDKSTVSLRFFPDTGHTKRADALLLIIYGYKLLLGIDPVKQSTADVAVNEALATAPNSPMPQFVRPLYRSWIHNHDYGLENVNSGFLEAIRLSEGGFYRLTPEGEAQAEKLAKDFIRRA